MKAGEFKSGWGDGGGVLGDGGSPGNDLPAVQTSLPYATELAHATKVESHRGNIPKGFHHSAQRCRDEGEATLGIESQIETNPNGVLSTAQLT